MNIEIKWIPRLENETQQSDKENDLDNILFLSL